MSKLYRINCNAKVVKKALTYIVAPKKLGVESKKNFYARVFGVFKDYENKLDNTLIIGGSDIYRALEKKGSTLNYADEKLHRGELATIENIVLPKIKRIKKLKENYN